MVLLDRLRNLRNSAPKPVNGFVGVGEEEAPQDMPKSIKKHRTESLNETIDQNGNNVAILCLSHEYAQKIITDILENTRYEVSQNGNVQYFLRDNITFVDHGRHLSMNDDASGNEQAILSAILHAKEKFRGQIEITGSDEFKERALAILVKYGVDVTLKNAAQELRFKELKKVATGQASPPGPPATAALPLPENGFKDDADEVAPVTSPDPAYKDQSQAPGSNPPLPDTDSNPSHPPDRDTSTLTEAGNEAKEADIQVESDSYSLINAAKWWQFQKCILESNSKPDELPGLLQQLGEMPPEHQFFWFKNGSPSDPPADTGPYIFNHLKEQSMSEANTGSDAEKKKATLVLRGVKKQPQGNDYDTTVLLFKGEGNHLQGHVLLPNGEKKFVVAHINERKPDPVTGEVKPNFLSISEAHQVGDKTKWVEVGHGNAINSRKDGKDVYFDEVLLNVQGNLLNCRVGKNCPDDVHRQLGFQQDRIERPAREARTATTNETPDKAAPAAQPDKAAPAEAPTAPQAVESAPESQPKQKKRTKSKAAA